jgi:hypothetical protein
MQSFAVSETHSRCRFVSTSFDIIPINQFWATYGRARNGSLNPLVWCETILTYAAPKSFVLYGRGSGFPSHVFYCWQQRGKLDLTIDRAELRRIFTSGSKATINTKVFGSLDIGQIVISEPNDPPPTKESVNAGQLIPDQPYTAPANPNAVRIPFALP